MLRQDHNCSEVNHWRDLTLKARSNATQHFEWSVTFWWSQREINAAVQSMVMRVGGSGRGYPIKVR